MDDGTAKLDALVAYLEAKERVCPLPQHWNNLWEMLPGKVRLGAGWSPSLPLILGAWWETCDLEKRIRLREHLEWAASHGTLDDVDGFLRSLAPGDWHTSENR